MASSLMDSLWKGLKLLEIGRICRPRHKQNRLSWGLTAAVKLCCPLGTAEYPVLVAFVFVFLFLSVQLKAECNKGYVKVQQVCVFAPCFSSFILDSFLMPLLSTVCVS